MSLRGKLNTNQEGNRYILYLAVLMKPRQLVPLLHRYCEILLSSYFFSSYFCQPCITVTRLPIFGGKQCCTKRLASIFSLLLQLANNYLILNLRSASSMQLIFFCQTQVHRAKLIDGRDVVIKVQHAEVAERLLQVLNLCKFQIFVICTLVKTTKRFR